jgi:hypothetical protein
VVAAIALFAPGLAGRARQAVKQGSLLAFRAATTAPYREYGSVVLHGDQAASVARMQALVPSGEPFLAWVASPFHLDFSRNRVLDVDVAGLANPWASTPTVRHVLWSYRGPAIRSVASCRAMEGSRGDEIAGERCAELQVRLASLAATGGAEVLADDGQTVLLRLRAPHQVRDGVIVPAP